MHLGYPKADDSSHWNTILHVTKCLFLLLTITYIILGVDVVSEDHSTGCQVLVDGCPVQIDVHEYFERIEGMCEYLMVDVGGEEAKWRDTYSNKTVRYLMVYIQN